MCANSPARVVRFSTFEVNLQTGELRKQGQKLKLQEQPFQVLAALLERPGEVVTREELRSKLWPSDTFVDFDHSLNAAIKRLRDVLGESAETPVFVETLARRGYRFIAPVNGLPDHVQTATALGRSKSFILHHWVAITFLSPIVIGVLMWALWRYPLRRAEMVERRLTLNSAENSISGAAISPDRRYLVYTDNTGVYLKLIRSGETHLVPLPPNFSARVDDWFPDASHLLVSHVDQTGKTSLWRISLFGGSPRHLADDASGGSVSPDGTHIAFRRGTLAYEGVWGREEWVMRSDGTDQVKVAADKSDGSEVGAPTWSPDGKRIAYIRSIWAYNARRRSLELNEWQSKSAQTIFSDDHLSDAVHWLSDGRLVYALGNVKTSSRQDSIIWVATLQPSGKISGSPKRIAQGHGRVSQITGSTDGKVVIFRSNTWSPSVYLGSLAPDGTHLLAKRRLTLDESVSIPSSWTPDSKAVLFNSDRNGTPEIFKQGVNELLAESLVTSADQVSQPRLTPDGSEVLYISTPKSGNLEAPSSIFAVPIDGGAPRLVLKDVGIYTVQCPRLASMICLYSTVKRGTWETFRFDVKSGKRVGDSQIDPGGNWDLSPDGSQRAIVPYHPDQETIQLRSTSTGEKRDLVVKGWPGLMSAGWSTSGRSLLVSWHNKPSESALLNVTLDGRASVLLRSNNSDIWSSVQSPDGRLLAICEASGTQNVWLIENFQ